MITFSKRIAESLKQYVKWSVLLIAIGAAGGALSASTDIAQLPVLGGLGSSVKPNIMLLMDTSNSMSWTHMPDQMEVEGNKQSIGYKSGQCNSLYYNPNQIYKIPKGADNQALPTPIYAAARSNYFTDAQIVNLSNAFQAHDASTVRSVVLSKADTPQAAYYYTYTGTATLRFNASPCTDADTMGAGTTGTVATVGGTWTRKLVSPSEQANFAIWYTYYRTRMGLAKSAIGSAFAPLNDTYRIGFLNGNPTISISGGVITSNAAVQSNRYEKIADFNTDQKTAWFSKLHGQAPAGSSPTREGLARVGRHYAGKTDGINQGMPEDPVQHACQPNFTILTTDGYWNTEAEKAGVSGGPTNMAGTAWVGQQDNPLTDDNGLSPRGIFDGVTSSLGYTETSNTTTSHAYEACSRVVSGKFTRVVRASTQVYRKTVTTSPLNDSTRSEARTSQLQKRTWKTSLSTVQYKLERTTTTQTTQQSKWYNPATETTTPVASCSGLTGCTTSTTGPIAVSSCSQSSGSAPDWIRVTCQTSTTNDPVASCAVGTAGCTKTVTGPTLVRGDQCPSHVDANWVFHTCTISDDQTSLVSSCSGTSYSATGNQTCSVVNQSGWSTMPSCTATGSSYTGTPPTRTECRTVSYCAPTVANNNCSASTVTTVGGACVPGTVGNVTTTCTLQTASGPTTVNPATCVNDPTPKASNGWVGTTCNTVNSSTTYDPACAEQGASVENGWVQTLCTGAVSVAGVRDRTTVITLKTRTYLDGTVVGPTASSNTSAASSCLDPALAPALPTDVTVVNPPTVVNSTFSGGSTNSLADVAQYYYKNDLRPTMDNLVRASGTEWYSDKANWQHMTTFVVGLGVSGTLGFREDYATASTGDFAKIRQGVLGWPRWPDPTLDYATYAQLYNDPRAIDDFWHTAVNGRGMYFSANNPDSVVSGIRGALAAIDATVGAGSALAISDVTGYTELGLSFISSYVAGSWTGDLIAQSVVAAGAAATDIWSLRTKLNSQSQGNCDDRAIWVRDPAKANQLGAFTWNTKNCATGLVSSELRSGLRGHFSATSLAGLTQYAEMSSSQIAAAKDAALVNFVRGQRQHEIFVAGNDAKLYRKRDAVLGDIINSKPQYVGPPYRKYTDAGYAAFKTANASRIPMVYVGGNDGMLHAVYAPGQGASATDAAKAGKEAWAYIPTAVIPNLVKLADTNYASKHRYFVDGTPVVADIKKDGTWRTILIGGLNAGGTGYYALDITNPETPISLWELDSSVVDMGLSFGKPVVGKLKDGRWVALLTSGYNNSTGRGKLYVVDAATGSVISTLDTGVGSSSSPSGLAHISAWVDFPGINDTVLRAYGGDLLGNVWRFDINDVLPPSGIEATLLGTAKDGTGTPQAVTTAPEVGVWNKQPYVFVGTGKLLGQSDLSDVQKQTVYAFVDTLGSTSLGNLRTVLKAHKTTTDLKIQCVGTTAECNTVNKKGWFVDLQISKERVNLPLTLIGTTLVIVTNEPKASSCTAGSTTRVYYAKGDSGETAATGQQISDLGVADFTFTRVKVPAGTGDGGSTTRYVAATREITGTRGVNIVPPVTPGAAGTGRISWRQLFNW